MQVVSHIDPKYGGLSAAVPALGEHIASLSAREITLAAFCAPGEEFRPYGYEEGRISFWPAGRGAWMRDSELTKRFTATVRASSGLHIHGLWEQSTAVAARTARTLKVPYIISAHGMLEPWALANKRIKKLVYAMLVEHRNVERANCLHALTRAEADHFIRFGARSPIAVIPNGVDVPQVRNATAFLAQYPELNDKRIVLFMARLHPKKGIDLLLQAWAEVVQEWPEARLVVAGPDTEGTLARLEQIVAEHSLHASVLFTGMLQGEMKWSALAAAECFILPSHSEGLSVSVLEAMGMGLPVIVTEPCNMPEVKQHRAGWEIQPTLEDVKRALMYVLSNPPAKNRTIGQNGARLVATRFAWGTVARQMEEVYGWMQGGAMPTSVDFIFP